MARTPQLAEESHAALQSELPQLNALDDARTHPALVESASKRQRRLEQCDQLTGRYTESVTLAALRRDEAHMRAVFGRHKDLDGGLSKDAFVAALREVAAPVIFSHDEDGVYKLADADMSGSVDFCECDCPLYYSFSPPLQRIVWSC